MKDDDLLRRAIDGDHSAQFCVGRRLIEGDNYRTDFPLAVAWLQKSLGAQNPDYEFYLGLLLCGEPPPLGDFHGGFAHVLKAAELGLSEAQYFAGAELAVGDNVHKDAAKAAYWYELAARQGHAEAQYNLAVMYEEGDGVAQDSHRAYEYLLGAAEAGDELAMKVLAQAYEDGSFGCSVDPQKATFWAHALEQSRAGGGTDWRPE